MEFKQLRAFLTIAETGNVTQAAEILHLVQPAVSRQLRLLEEDIGTPLFKRSRHGMILTAAGQSLLGYARRALLELDRARVEMCGREGRAISGLVTLGLLPSTTEILSSALLSAIADRYPGIRVRLATGYAGTLVSWLQSGEIDAALLYGADNSAHIQTTALASEPLWVIAPAEARLRGDSPLSLADLADQKLVLPSAPHGIRTLVEHACAVSNVTLQISAETNSLSIQRTLILGGHGWTILPPIAVADDLQSGRLSGAPLIDPKITRTIVLALPTDRPSAAHVRCSVELLSQTIKEAIHSGTWPQGKWLAG